MDILASIGAAAKPITVKKESERGKDKEKDKKKKAGLNRATTSGRNKNAPAKGKKSKGGRQDENKKMLATSTGGVQDSSPNTLAAEAAAIAGITALTQRAIFKNDETPAAEPMADTGNLRMQEESAAGALMILSSPASESKSRKRSRGPDNGNAGTPRKQNKKNGDSSGPSPARLLIKVKDERDESGVGFQGVSAAGTLVGVGGAFSTDAPNTPSKRKPCNCKNSKCLKLYCECFAAGLYCEGSCNCHSCHNNSRFQADRQAAIGATLERNPHAFKPKIAQSPLAGNPDSPAAGRHMKGCHCKKSGCLKKYCECFQAGVMCTDQCKCVECRNNPESHENNGKGMFVLSGGRADKTGASTISGLPNSPSPSPMKRSKNAAALAALSMRPIPVVDGQKVTAPPATLATPLVDPDSASSQQLAVDTAKSNLDRTKSDNLGTAQSRESTEGGDSSRLVDGIFLRKNLNDDSLKHAVGKMLRAAEEVQESDSRPGSTGSGQLDVAPGEQRPMLEIPAGATEGQEVLASEIGEIAGPKGEPCQKQGEEDALKRQSNPSGALERAVLAETCILLKQLTDTVLSRPSKQPRGAQLPGLQATPTLKPVVGKYLGDTTEDGKFLGESAVPTSGPEPGETVCVAMGLTESEGKERNDRPKIAAEAPVNEIPAGSAGVVA